ncbi:unnamed protein product [Somion occarium]|uniref:Uncharacterized protein n=1 Tax=Somion occarium TaxID=3059160 RepID=A0ABP1CRP7_9APHY
MIRRPARKTTTGGVHTRTVHSMYRLMQVKNLTNMPVCMKTLKLTAVHPSILGQHREIYHRYPGYSQNAIDPSKDDCLTCIPLYFCTETDDHSAVTRSRLAREKMMEERARQLRQARKSSINAVKLVPLVAPPRSKQLDEPRSAPLVYLDPRKNTSQSNRWISEPATSPAPSSPAEQLLWDNLSMTSWTNSEPTSQWGNEFEDLFPSMMEDIEANSSCSASSIPDFLWDNIPLDPTFPPPVLDSSLDDLFMPDSNDMSDAERLFFPPKVLSPDELKAMGEELFAMIEQPVDQSISV